jgi:hypothetical protein
MFVSSEPSYFASFSTGLETFSQLLYEDEYGAVRISFFEHLTVYFSSQG